MNALLISRELCERLHIVAQADRDAITQALLDVQCAAVREFAAAMRAKERCSLCDQEIVGAHCGDVCGDCVLGDLDDDVMTREEA